MSTLSLLLYIAAFICFVAAALQKWKTPFIAIGLAFAIAPTILAGLVVGVK